MFGFNCDMDQYVVKSCNFVFLNFVLTNMGAAVAAPAESCWFHPSPDMALCP